jgi:catechol 2,3-dioxygenase-like lactoylglutathione lyase family enzyme
MEKLDSDVIAHVAMVVRDVEKASRHFEKIFGKPRAEPMMTGPYAESRAEYRGAPTEGRAKLAFFPVGPNLTIELVEPVGGPSTWSEFLERHGPGIHHLGLFVKGMDGNVAFLGENGIPLVHRGKYPGGRFAYCDATDRIGAILELLENDEKGVGR